MKHIVKFTESERGWGGQVSFIGYDTMEEAKDIVAEQNKDLPTDHVPDYYCFAEYEGEADTVPESYKF